MPKSTKEQSRINHERAKRLTERARELVDRARNTAQVTVLRREIARLQAKRKK